MRCALDSVKDVERVLSFPNCIKIIVTRGGERMGVETIRCIKIGCYPNDGCKHVRKNEAASDVETALAIKRGGSKHRKRLIDQTVELMGYHRKSAIRALAAKSQPKVEIPGRAGRPKKYDSGLM